MVTTILEPRVAVRKNKNNPCVVLTGLLGGCVFKNGVCACIRNPLIHASAGKAVDLSNFGKDMISYLLSAVLLHWILG